MKLLQDILYKVPIREHSGNLNLPINDLQIDSRLVKPNSCFIAIKGNAIDGHGFIGNAIANGASCIICEIFPSNMPEGVVFVKAENSSTAAGIMAHNFYDNPSNKIRLIGVTGTNGKTTVATLLYRLFTSLGYDCGLLSTVQNVVAGNAIPASHTTPDPISLNKLLAQMVSVGCTYAFMEVSSHAIHQNRIAGLNFSGGVFTNITHDHLDYHKSFDEYIKVKKTFFDALPSDAFALSNLDDKRGEVMLQNSVAKKSYYSLKSLAEFKGKILDNALTGLNMLVNEQEVHFRLIGEFNAYNLLAVYGAAILLGEEKGEVLRSLSELKGAEGRFEYLMSPIDRIIGIVDYAHTPDALENVLKTILQLRKGYEKIITVVGCGGDRDKTKRPVMGRIACELSDKVIFTSDNPRTEDPMVILKEMELDLNTASKRKFLSISDRREAIRTAINLANKEDIILIAGKGHEKYQDLNGIKFHFDDKEELEKAINDFGK